jgi:5-methylcytosine-specific restriction protein A
MPTRANRTCPVPGCNAPTKSGRCTAHRKAARRASPYREPPRLSSTKRGYGGAHRRRREAYLAEHPVCEARGCTAASTDLDHIDGDVTHNPANGANFQALCRRHHSRKTVRHDGGFGNSRSKR